MDIKEIDSILMGKCVFHRFIFTEQEYCFSKKRKTNKQKKKKQAWYLIIHGDNLY